MKIQILAVALCLLPTVAMQAQDDRLLRDSLKQAAEVLAYHPDSIDLRLRKASFNMQLQQWEYAKDEYDYVLGRNPYNVAALYYRAYANEQLRRYSFARLDYENLLKVVPGNFEGQLGLALLNQKDRRYTEAYNQINRLVELFPDSAVAYAARAGMERERNMYDLAEYDYTEALRRRENTDWRLARADVRIKLKKRDAAKSDLDQLVRQGVSPVALKEWYRQIKR